MMVRRAGVTGPQQQQQTVHLKLEEDFLRSPQTKNLCSLDDEIMEMIVLIVTDLFLGVSLMRFVVVICYDMSQCSVLSPSPGVRLGANCTSAHLQLSSWGPSGVAAQ